ncbi:DUF1015 domain-containing protein [Thermomonospora umbrina]|uniref:DUF1015 domain-containing protein n=1 Tax=Thermomonospora umbrina TaxID=111806 RepID=UPI003CCC6E4B
MDADLPYGMTPEDFSARVFGVDEPGRGAEDGLVLRPFRGVRFAPEVVGDLAAVTTPPYDLIDDDEVGRLMAGDGHNVVRLILPRGANDETAPLRAADTLRDWLADGALIVDDEPALYVYETTTPDGTRQRGLIGAVGLRAESERVILPHENVFPGPVRDRLDLMTATGANLEPIFLIYDGTPDPKDVHPRPGDTGGSGSAGAGGVSDAGAAVGRVDGGGTLSGGSGVVAEVVDEVADRERPVLAFRADDGTAHRLWRVTDPRVHARVADGLRGRRALIADGHHRYATYRALQARRHAAGEGHGPWDYGLALLVDSARYPPHLGAIHRVLPGLGPEQAVERAKGAFHVSAPFGGPEKLDAAVKALGEVQGTGFLLAGGDRLHLLAGPDEGLSAEVMPPSTPSGGVGWTRRCWTGCSSIGCGVSTPMSTPSRSSTTIRPPRSSGPGGPGAPPSS